MNFILLSVKEQVAIALRTNMATATPLSKRCDWLQALAGENQMTRFLPVLINLSNSNNNGKGM